jgi:hypothetical protein
MIRFAAEEYQECKIWIAQKKEEGYSWNDIKKLCTNDEMFEEEFKKVNLNDKFELAFYEDFGAGNCLVSLVIMRKSSGGKPEIVYSQDCDAAIEEIYNDREKFFEKLVNYLNSILQ